MAIYDVRDVPRTTAAIREYVGAAERQYTPVMKTSYQAITPHPQKGQNYLNIIRNLEAIRGRFPQGSRPYIVIQGQIENFIKLYEKWRAQKIEYKKKVERVYMTEAERKAYQAQKYYEVKVAPHKEIKAVPIMKVPKTQIYFPPIGGIKKVTKPTGLNLKYEIQRRKDLALSLIAYKRSLTKEQKHALHAQEKKFERIPIEKRHLYEGYQDWFDKQSTAHQKELASELIKSDYFKKYVSSPEGHNFMEALVLSQREKDKPKVVGGTPIPFFEEAGKVIWQKLTGVTKETAKEFDEQVPVLAEYMLKGEGWKKELYDDLKPEIRRGLSYVKGVTSGVSAMVTFPEFLAEEVVGRAYTGIKEGTLLTKHFFEQPPVQIIPPEVPISREFIFKGIGEHFGASYAPSGLSTAMGEGFSQITGKGETEPWKIAKRYPLEAFAGGLGELSGMYYGGKGMGLAWSGAKEYIPKGLASVTSKITKTPVTPEAVRTTLHSLRPLPHVSKYLKKKLTPTFTGQKRIDIISPTVKKGEGQWTPEPKGWTSTLEKVKEVQKRFDTTKTPLFHATAESPTILRRALDTVRGQIDDILLQKVQRPLTTIYKPASKLESSIIGFLRKNDVVLSGSSAMKLQTKASVAGFFRKIGDWDLIVNAGSSGTKKMAHKLARYIKEKTGVVLKVKESKFHEGYVYKLYDAQGKSIIDVASTKLSKPAGGFPSTVTIDGVRVTNIKELIRRKVKMVAMGDKPTQSITDLHIMTHISKAELKDLASPEFYGYILKIKSEGHTAWPETFIAGVGRRTGIKGGAPVEAMDWSLYGQAVEWPLSIKPISYRYTLFRRKPRPAFIGTVVEKVKTFPDIWGKRSLTDYQEMLYSQKPIHAAYPSHKILGVGPGAEHELQTLFGYGFKKSPFLFEREIPGMAKLFKTHVIGLKTPRGLVQRAYGRYGQLYSKITGTRGYVDTTTGVMVPIKPYKMTLPPPAPGMGVEAAKVVTKVPFTTKVAGKVAVKHVKKILKETREYKTGVGYKPLIHEALIPYYVAPTTIAGYKEVSTYQPTLKKAPIPPYGPIKPVKASRPYYKPVRPSVTPYYYPSIPPDYVPPYTPPERPEKPYEYEPYRPTPYEPYRPPPPDYPEYPEYPEEREPSYPSPPSYPYPRVPPRKPIRGAALLLPELKRPKMPVTKQGFDTFVKSKGKYIKVNTKPLYEEQANALGAHVTDNTAARTFYIKGTKEPAQTAETKYTFKKAKFRKPIKKGKPFLTSPKWIEKTTHAIDTQGEFEGITVKGWLAQRKRLSTKQKRSIKAVKPFVGIKPLEAKL